MVVWESKITHSIRIASVSHKNYIVVPSITYKGSVDLSLVTSRYLKGLNCTIFWKRYQLRQFYRWKASSCRYLGILRSGGPWIGDRGIYFLQKLKLFHNACQNFGNFSEISNFCQTLPYSTKQNFWNSFFPILFSFFYLTVSKVYQNL